MKGSFSFTEKPILYIMRNFPSLLPGIEKVVAIYYSEGSHLIEAHTLTKELVEYRSDELIIESPAPKLLKLRQDSSPYSWIRKEDVPFEITIKDKVQLNIFNELNNNILLIRIFNPADNLHDLLFVYFKEDLSNFGISANAKSLTTENKTIIAHLVRNTVMTLLLNLQHDRERFESLRDNMHSLAVEIERLKTDLDNARGKSLESLRQMCLSSLAEISRKHQVNFRMTESAVKKLAEFSGNYPEFNSMLERAASFALSLHIDNSTRDITISDFHMILDVPVQKPKEIIPVKPDEVPVKYSKTLVLLDKLENAAVQLKTKNKLLTSANLCNEFTTPITPPAISDALKKHRMKIIYLFKEFPERWTTIRSEFRPVQNVLNFKPDLNQRTA
jgi:hypothetical protein